MILHGFVNCGAVVGAGRTNVRQSMELKKGKCTSVSHLPSAKLESNTWDTSYSYSDWSRNTWSVWEHWFGHFMAFCHHCIWIPHTNKYICSQLFPVSQKVCSWGEVFRNPQDRDWEDWNCFLLLFCKCQVPFEFLPEITWEVSSQVRTWTRISCIPQDKITSEFFSNKVARFLDSVGFTPHPSVPPQHTSSNHQAIQLPRCIHCS